jgi:hypothetical protein
VGVIFIAIYLVLIALVLEVASTLLIISGLKKEIARFQAVSMLTATGFTTLESELVLRHPIRRNIAIFLILFGVFSLAVLISIISNLMGQNLRIPVLVTITLSLAIILVTVKNKKMMARLTKKFHRHLNQQFELHQLPIEEVLYTNEMDLVIDIHVPAGSEWLQQKTDKVFCGEEDMLLLFIQRDHQKIRQQCMQLEIQEGDILFVYGSKSDIEKKFQHELRKEKREMDQDHNVMGI